jgi:hypothetical protein
MENQTVNQTPEVANPPWVDKTAKASTILIMFFIYWNLGNFFFSHYVYSAYFPYSIRAKVLCPSPERILSEASVQTPSVLISRMTFLEYQRSMEEHRSFFVTLWLPCFLIGYLKAFLAWAFWILGYLGNFLESMPGWIKRAFDWLFFGGMLKSVGLG